MTRPRALILTAAAALFLGTADANAQVRRGRQQPEAPPWAPISVGVRGGWEQERLASDGMLGAEVRLPVLRDGRVEVVPSFDAIFLNPEREDQVNLDVFYVPGGRGGGVFIGGGFAWRQSVIAGIGQGVSRQRYTGFNIALGGKQPVGPVHLMLTVRWTLLNDTEFDPNSVAIGVSLPLWSAGPRAGR
jgi:hypothetical protein